MCILGAVPFAACGFIRYHGMTAEQLLWGMDQVRNSYAQTAGIQVRLSVLPGYATLHCRGLQAQACYQPEENEIETEENV